jgi:hypothetical protein
MINNIYFYLWESDMLCIDRDNQVIEIEVKCSKWDYLKDAQKVDKHDKLENPKNWSEIPNKFIYAVDEKFVNDIEIPEYAGLIIIHKRGMDYMPSLIKKAPKLHSTAMDPNKWEKLAIALHFKNQ